MIVHGLILVALGLWVIPRDDFAGQAGLDISPGLVDQEEVEDFDLESLDAQEINVDMAAPVELEPALDDAPAETAIVTFDDLGAMSPLVDLDELTDMSAMGGDLLAEIGALDINPLEGRGGATRAALVKQGGGTEGSELAVTLALAWLAEHQNSDGGWSLQHDLGPCRGRCPNPGRIESTLNGATALALLPFLGAGETHRQGKYQKTVSRGIEYLVRAIQESEDGGLRDRGGQLYSHGLSAIVLSEAYAMTKDERLEAPAQQAIDYTVFAQDPIGGGWRYTPQQAGDTSAVGWQIMALKSGQMAYLDVPENTLRGATVFLDSVQQSGGTFYGYTAPGRTNRSGLTAVGLLSRMYLGWERNNPALQRGVQWFGKRGPRENDFYSNYYAMQLMFHYTGAKGRVWNKWNHALREQLLDSQETEGHMRGSWYQLGGASESNSSGGRLYCTAMATMILEVYYRHMPIYGQVFADGVGDGAGNIDDAIDE